MWGVNAIWGNNCTFRKLLTSSHCERKRTVKWNRFRFENVFHTHVEQKLEFARYKQLVAFLPPATKLGQGNIFRSVIQEFCPMGGGRHAWQGGACVAEGGMHSRTGMCGRGCAWQGAYVAEQACMAGVACMTGGVCMARGGMCGRYYGIRSMSGRYASYWNAILYLYVLKSMWLSHSSFHLWTCLNRWCSHVSHLYTQHLKATWTKWKTTEHTDLLMLYLVISRNMLGWIFHKRK